MEITKSEKCTDWLITAPGPGDGCAQPVSALGRCEFWLPANRNALATTQSGLGFRITDRSGTS